MDKILSLIAASLILEFTKIIPKISVGGLNLKEYRQEDSYLPYIQFQPDQVIAWLEFEKYSFAVQLYVPDTICENKEIFFESAFSFRGQEIYIHRDNVSLIHSFKNAKIFIDIYGDSKDFLTISRNDWKSYDLVNEVIINIKDAFKNERLDQTNKNNIIYGFEYNKDLGINVVNKVINDLVIDYKDITDLKLDKNTQLSSIYNHESLIFGETSFTEKIVATFKRDDKFDDIQSFNTINYIYQNAAIEFFINKGYTVYKVSISGNLVILSKTLFITKNNSISIKLGLYIDDDNVAVFTRVTKTTIESNSFKTDIPTYKFIDILTKFNEIDEGSTIYITEDYDDYQLFNDFKDLEVPISDNYSFGLHYHYTDKGIILPFYLESNEIKLHNLNLLYDFVQKKSYCNKISIADIEFKYVNLITLIKELTSECSRWNNFFENNTY